jgi:hypothetical protein
LPNLLLEEALQHPDGLLEKRDAANHQILAFRIGGSTGDDDGRSCAHSLKESRTARLRRLAKDCRQVAVSILPVRLEKTEVAQFTTCPRREAGTFG